MRKLTKWLIPALLLLLCVTVFVMYYIDTQSARDTTAPTLYIESDPISLSVQDDQDTFLAGVTAWDTRDGDVTDLVVVEGISAVDSEGCVTVTYAAFDHSGNVAKAQRKAVYTDYVGPKFSLESALVFRSGRSVDLFSYVTAEDPIDGDLTDRIKATMVDGTSDIREEGLHQVELRVSNSMGDTVRLTVPVDVYDPVKYDSTVNLSEYLIYLKKGSSFDAQNYLENLYAGYRTITPENLIGEGAKIEIHSDVDPNLPGIYSAAYTITYGNHTGYTRLIVVVEE